AVERQMTSGLTCDLSHVISSSSSRFCLPFSPINIDSVKSPSSDGCVPAAFDPIHFRSEREANMRRSQSGAERKNEDLWPRYTLMPLKKMGTSALSSGSSSVNGR